MERASDTNALDNLSDALDSFRCCLDEDIENFLRHKAMEFVRRNWCSVYLIVDEQSFDRGRIKIDAYFTLSHKSLIPTEASKTNIKNASGFKDSESVHSVLIGQLGKYMEEIDEDRILAGPIHSREILDNAFEIIELSNTLIPCRCALVECNDNVKVHQIYADYGFKFFQYDGGHYQFYRLV